MGAITYRRGPVEIAAFTGDLIGEQMYILQESEDAIVIDPHADSEALDVLRDCRSVSAFLTHEHYDHISGVNWLREYTDCTVYASQKCAAIIKEMDNGTLRFPFLFIADKEKFHHVRTMLKTPYVCCADIGIADRQRIAWHGHELLLVPTPGHSPGGMSVLLDQTVLFSGDNLLGNGQELKSIGANPKQFAESLQYYESLQKKDRICVFPGHGEPDSLENYFVKIRNYCTWN